MDFHQRVLPAYREKFAALAHAQRPEELFVACSDSRVVVDLFSESEPGDMFEVRNVGNMIPPSDAALPAQGSCGAGAAIEYAVTVLGVRDIVILGHSECGAMKAIAGVGAKPEGVPNLAGWLRYGLGALAKLEAGGSLDPSLAVHNQLSQLNVLEQIEHIKTYPCAQRAINEGNLRTHGWWFDVATADVYAFDTDEKKFVRLEASLAEKLLAMGD